MTTQTIQTIMIIRHAEKPGSYTFAPPLLPTQTYQGFDLVGDTDPTSQGDSLISMGWARAGGLIRLFASPTSPLVTPDCIYTSSPGEDADTGKAHSQRPYQTTLPLAAMLNFDQTTFDSTFSKKHFPDMVTAALKQSQSNVLICWQHEDILTSTKSDPPNHSIVDELLRQTKSDPTNLNLPKNPWPGSRFDMVLVFTRDIATGHLTSFSQVPQMLLPGDSSTPFT